MSPASDINLSTFLDNSPNLDINLSTFLGNSRNSDIKLSSSDKYFCCKKVCP